MEAVTWIKTALGYVASAYIKDVVVRPRQVASLARSYCDRVGKPLLNIGAGTASTSLRTALLGPTLWGDVNVDNAAPRDVPHGPKRVSFADAYQLPWADHLFGAVIASHVLEHLARPDLALIEWRRVADKVFVVVPPWWAPHTWLHPGHRWYIDPSLKTAYPVWTDRRNIYLLPLSDKGRYRGASWSPRTIKPTTPTKNPNLHGSSSPLVPTSRRLSPTSLTTVGPNSERAPERSSGGPVAVSGLPTSEPFGSSNSISTLTVVSERTSGSS